MRQVPLPPAIAGLLRWDDTTSRSLVFDRAFWLPEPARTREADRQTGDDKGAFLARFRDDFAEPPGFSDFLERRRVVLETLGARSVKLKTSSRLIVGLGLPHPVETGFLFDRMTGSPYLPGSSVKGLLRAAARLAAAEELDIPGASDAGPYFKQHLDRLFGPELGTGVAPARGELVLYDAFPEAWPRLELDVLTPHQGDYYGSTAAVPADWHQPIPVPFLSVAPGTQLSFFTRALAREPDQASRDLRHAHAVLCAALDWLGAGAKTSAGYGTFEAPAGTTSLVGSTSESLVWKDANLSWIPNERRLEARHESFRATSTDASLLEVLPEEARTMLTRKGKRKTLKCDVTVRKRSETWFEMVTIRMSEE